MLSHCANSRCSKPFLRLREGKLFVVEAGQPHYPSEPESPPFQQSRHSVRRVERYWLCDQCAAVWTLIYEGTEGIRLTPLPRRAASVPVAMAAKLGVA